MGQTITFGAHEVDPAAAPPGVVFSAADGATAPAASVGTRFAEGAWKNLNPLGLVHAVAHPIDTLGALIDAQVEQIQQAKSLYGQRRYTEAAGHLGAGLLPLVGPPAAKAGERIGSGDIAGGLGEATGLLAALEAPKVVPKVVGAATRAATAGVTRAVEALPSGSLAADIAPDLVGAVFPRTANSMRVLQKIRAKLGDAAAADVPAATTKGGIPPPADLTAPHLDTSTPIPPSQLTTQQLAERMLYGRDFGPREAPVPKPPLGARSAATAPAAPPIDAPPLAAPPDVPAPPAAAAAPAPAPTSPAASTWSPQRIRNEVGLAARRGKLTLSDAQLDQADALVQAGQSPASAVRSVAPPPKVKITAAEMGVYTELRRRGLTQAQAADLIATQRQLAQSLGTPSSEAIRQAVEQRNLTGRWDE
jgi:hypothetical protein